MSLAHAFHAHRLAAPAGDPAAVASPATAATTAEVAAAEFRAIARARRRAARAAAARTTSDATPHVYRERGRHRAAPAPVG